MHEVMAKVPEACAQAVWWAAEQRTRSDGDAHVEAHWHRAVGCHLMITHQRMVAPQSALAPLAAVLYSAARLPEQPWYAQFRGGVVVPWEGELAAGVARACFATSSVDVGLPALRAYRVLCTESVVDEQTRVVALQSVDEGPPQPKGTVLAELWPPSGDVVVHDGTWLHWHHVMVTPGIGLGPRWLDHNLLATLRNWGWDAQERATYVQEAQAMAKFVSEHDLAAFCVAHQIEVAE